MKDGIIMPRSKIAIGITDRRYGSKHTNVYTARKDRVCDQVFQPKILKTRAWKTNTTPILELNRRKLVDIVVMLNPGRSAKLWAADADADSRFLLRSSTGMTCCSSLNRQYR